MKHSPCSGGLRSFLYLHPDRPDSLDARANGRAIRRHRLLILVCH